MIRSIRLLNWRSHADSQLSFHNGTNLLVGIMGAGKSSILEGISFALYGTFPALERRKLKMANLVRLNHANAKVILEFSWEDSLYRIERTIEKTKKATSTGAEIFKDGSLVEHGTSPVTTYVTNLLSVDYDLFTRAIYSEQNNIDYFLNLDPRRRKQEIDTLLGLDKFETARANIVTVAGRVRSKKQGIAERFSQDKLQELQKKEQEHSKELSETEAKFNEVKTSYEKKQLELKELAAAFDQMKKDKLAFDNLEKESIRLTAQKQSLEKEVIPLDGYEETKSELSKYAEERSRISSSIKSTDQKIAALSKESGTILSEIKSAAESKARHDNLKKELSQILKDENPEDLEKKQKEVEQSLLSFRSEQKSLEAQISELSDLVGKLKPGISSCPLCSNPLNEQALLHVREERESVITKNKERISEISNILDSKKRENELLSSRVKKASLLSDALGSLVLKDTESLQKRAAELEAETSSLSKEKQSFQEKLDAAGERMEKLRLKLSRFEDSVKKQKELDEIKKRISSVAGQLQSIRFDQDAFESLREKTESIRIEAERLTSSRQSLEMQLKMSKDLLKIVREELSSLRELQTEIKKLYSLEEELLIYKNALLETQTSLRSTLTDAINSAMNELWPIFYPYHNYRALRLSVSEKDYVFEVNDGEWKSLDTIASGGERASAALTLRVALAMVLTPKLSWLVLDEPTHNLDSQAVEMLSSALQFKVPEVVKQTFVITHDEAFMGSDFASSYKLTRDKEHNGETKVEVI